MGISIPTRETVEIKQLKWYGHVKRISENRWPRKIWEWIPVTRRKRGRPKRRWRNHVEEAMVNRGISDRDCYDRKRLKLGCERR